MVIRPFKRVIWVVLDGVGVGELPDASQYGDQGSDTLGNLAHAFLEKEGRPLQIPYLRALGASHLSERFNKARQQTDKKLNTSLPEGIAFYGKAIERSQGKDTTSGHWEMAGLVVKEGFKTYPQGFPKTIVERWVKENELPGVLGNYAASGTEIIEKLGHVHLESGKPILYASADSVWQVAAHEQAFGLSRLYEICESARKICDELKIGRVIARPFIGDPLKGEKFKRTYNRKDYAQAPFDLTLLDYLTQAKVSVYGIGKIGSIYAYRGVSESTDTQGNTHGIQVLLNQMKTHSQGLLFCNLIDFDMLYGHRRDVKGFGLALEEFDQSLFQILTLMEAGDLLLIDADHGNDPTFRGSDHTREYIPVLGFAKPFKSQNKNSTYSIGIRESFGDIGLTVGEALLGSEANFFTRLHGKSFLSEILKS